MTVRGKAGRRDAALNHPSAFTPVGLHAAAVALGTVNVLSPPSDNINAILIQAGSQNVRVTLDGVTSPSSTTGFLIEVGKPPSLIILTEETSSIRVIEVTAGGFINYQWGTVATQGS